MIFIAAFKRDTGEPVYISGSASARALIHDLNNATEAYVSRVLTDTPYAYHTTPGDLPALAQFDAELRAAGIEPTEISTR